jgi:hypothetical protein
MVAVPLGLKSGASQELRVTFVSVKVGGVFDHIDIVYAGGRLRSTDSTLNSKVTTKASAFVSSADADLLATLNAGVQSPSSATMIVAADLLTALKASLADSDAGWYVRSKTQHTDAATGVKTLSVCLTTMDVKFSPATGTLPIPASFVYQATINAQGALVIAYLMLNGAQWRTSDSALHTAVMTLADAYQTTQSTQIATALA